MRFILFALGCLFLFSCSGAQTNSDGGDLTRLEVEYISRNLAAATESKYPLLKHKLVTQYVDSLGQAIISRNSKDMPPLPYEFRVLKTNEVLLFSLPGGIVYISLGALRELTLEGELVAAISHELAHQQLSHQLTMWRKRVNANRERAFQLTFADSTEWSPRFLGERGYLFYGEAMEVEADQLTPIIMYRAQYDPRAALSYVDALKKIEEKNIELAVVLNSLHPPFDARIRAMKSSLVKLPPLKESKISSATFTQIKQLLKEAEKKRKEDR